jgi:hypothetical protein
MTTLTINKVCEKTHTPNKSAISTVWEDSEFAKSYTFCEECEQNITQSSWYDDDRGIVWSKWTVGK